MINHVTVHVPQAALKSPMLTTFLGLLGMMEVDPDDPFEHGWEVRWFKSKANEPPTQTYLHLISDGDGQDILCLGHVCISGCDMDLVRVAAHKSDWLERDSGSGRIWLRFYNLRVEARA